MVWTIGVDIGGTKVEVGLVDAAGRLHAHLREATDPSLQYGTVVNQVVSLVRALKTRYPGVQGVGVGVAGQVDPHTGHIFLAPNLDWQGVALRDDLTHSLGLPVFVINDVQAATWGEWRYGAGRGVDHLVCVFLGTGIGGGVVLDGQLQTGASGSLGEVGHLTIVAEGRPCHCGARGCLEAYAGGWAIAEQFREDLESNPDVWRTDEEERPTPERASAEVLAALVRRGHPRARQWVQTIGHFLGVGMVSIVNLLNPRRIVLGGGLLDGFPEWLAMVQEDVRTGALPSAARTVEIVQAALGPYAGVIGAAALARHRLRPS